MSGLLDLLLFAGVIAGVIWYLVIPLIGYIASASGSGLGGGLKWGLVLLVLISILVIALQFTRRKIRHGRDLASFMLEVKKAQLWIEKINEQQPFSIKEVSRIRQGDGSDVFGPNDPRKAAIGI